MLLGNHSLSAVLQQRPDWDAEWTEHTLDFLCMLLTKVLLNCVVAFNYGLGQRPACSFMSLCFLSFCVADFLLAAALAAAATANRLLDCCGGYPGYEALVLTHASAVYAFLPLPVLALGALDYYATAAAAAAPREGGFRFRWPGGGVGQGAAVLALWVLAGLRSAVLTDSSVLEVKRRPGALRWARVCDVRAARDVDLFCLALLAAVVAALLLHLPHVPRWTRLVHQVAPEMEAHGAQRKRTTYRDLPLAHNKMPLAHNNLPLAHANLPLAHGNLPVSNSKMPVTHGNLPVWSVEMAMERQQQPCQRDPPAYVACVLLFAVPWCPYLLLHLSSVLLDLAVPSYTSVNTLWLSCANSLLAGVTSWALAGQRASVHHLDHACDWRVPVYLSYRGNRLCPWHQVPQELKTPSQRKLKPRLLI